MQNIGKLSSAYFNLYQGISQNSLLRIKLAKADRLKQTILDINAKYDRSKSTRAEDAMTKISDAKIAVADQKRALESSLQRLQDVKEQLPAMATAINTVAPDAWDYAFSTMQTSAGSTVLLDTNLAGRLGDGGGGFRDPTTMVSAGSLDVAVSHHYVAADYSLEMADGTVLQPDQDAKTLSGGTQSFSFANLSVTTLNGDQVTFHDSASNQDYTATLHRGGNGLMNSWFYNGFTGDGLTRAQDDLQAANHYIMSTENDWQVSSGQMDSMVTALGQQFSLAKDEYEKSALDEINAKNAEINAAKNKFDLSTNLLSLTSGSATDMIQQMFMTDSFSYQKSSIYDIMSSSA